MTQKWKTNQTTSKFHKPHINGKPKRPRTHQYPYLGPKVAVVAGKLDPTVIQICFCRTSQTVMNLEKRTTEMSSEGPKMVGNSYGLAWNGRKMTKSGDPRWRLPPCSPARSERVRRWLPQKFHGDGRLVVALLPGRRVYSSGCRNRLLRLKTDRPKNGSKRPSSGFSDFWDFLSGVGVGSSLGTQNWAYIEPRVVFG